MPRPKSNKIRIHISLSPEMLSRLDLLCFRDNTKALAYGKRGEIIETALRYYLTQQGKDQSDDNLE